MPTTGRNNRSHLKNRILVQDRGGAASQTGAILEYCEDLRCGTYKDIGPKDIFEIASSKAKEIFGRFNQEALPNCFSVAYKISI